MDESGVTVADSLKPVVLAAPHRLFFLLGAIQLVLSILLWLIVLAGRYIPAALVLSLTVGGTSAHIFPLACVTAGGVGAVVYALWLWTFVLVQLTAVVRVLAEIPLPGHGYAYLVLVLIASGLWLIAFIPWSLRFGAMYLRPRVDGATG